jgi:hypothetical protein
MNKSERFAMMLSRPGKLALERLARRERSSAAAVVRRLIWREAERQGLVVAEQTITTGLVTEEVSDDRK